MLFEQRLRKGIQDGSITLAFRRWKRSQVVAGGRYRMGAGAGLAHVTAVEQVDPATISTSDAQAAGFESPAAVRAYLAGSDDMPVFRIEFGRGGQPDPREILGQRDELSSADLDELNRRLDRLDRSSAHGPWTRATLTAIEQSPATRAGDLAPRLGWAELQDFKLHVRKLKALGLTISLLVGYELSPRGAAYLRALGVRPTRTPSALVDRPNSVQWTG